jgi:hypothetical protein
MKCIVLRKTEHFHIFAKTFAKIFAKVFVIFVYFRLKIFAKTKIFVSTLVYSVTKVFPVWLDYSEETLGFAFLVSSHPVAASTKS